MDAKLTHLAPPTVSVVWISVGIVTADGVYGRAGRTKERVKWERCKLFIEFSADVVYKIWRVLVVSMCQTKL